MQFLQKCYQNLVRNVRHCNNLAKFAILVQTCKILVRNAKLARISEEFCKICDSCNPGNSHFLEGCGFFSFNVIKAVLQDGFVLLYIKCTLLSIASLVNFFGSVYIHLHFSTSSFYRFLSAW